MPITVPASERLALDSPFTLPNGTVVKNRVCKSAMSEQLGDRRHDPLPGLAVLYAKWAQGGAGLSISGKIMIDRAAIGQLGNVVLDQHSHLPSFRPWTSAGTQNGTELWAQLNHPGKQIVNLLCAEPVAPSAISLEGGLERNFNRPRALTEREIEETIEKFGSSARLAIEVGFTGVQIHGAHGYLISQFLSPRHNQRSDGWGGSLENRMRFAVETYRAIRRQVGDGVPVGIKLNSADFMKGGFSEEESIQVAERLCALGIDQIEVSGGTYESPVMASDVPASTAAREAYFLAYAARVRARVDTPLMVTGGFRSSAGMLAALRSGATDFVGVARPFALDPALAIKAMSREDFRLDIPRLTTRIPALDRMAALNVSWYEDQLARMARNRAPDPRRMAWSSVGRTFLYYARCALRGRRHG
jgi:2,4-dienoyl-CoA reductase-like NADH-dependent reductase (Old Yellow Enzyme family)